jgi:hypothetical protein
MYLATPRSYSSIINYSINHSLYTNLVTFCLFSEASLGDVLPAGLLYSNAAFQLSKCFEPASLSSMEPSVTVGDILIMNVKAIPTTRHTARKLGTTSPFSSSFAVVSWSG